MLPPNRLTATYTGPAELPGTRGPGQGCWLFATALAGKPGFISIPAEPTVLTSQRGIGLAARTGSPRSQRDSCYRRKGKVPEEAGGEEARTKRRLGPLVSGGGGCMRVPLLHKRKRALGRRGDKDGQIKTTATA